MNYWILTDSHMGHTRMAEYCKRPEGYEGRLLDNLKNNVQRGDVLIHLGDVCFGRDAEWNSAVRFATGGASRWLCLGNHDKKSTPWYLDHGWDFVGLTFSMKLYGKIILFSHKPQPDNGYDYNIHGHYHNNDSSHWEPELLAIRNDKQVLLACEYENYMPVQLETILDRIQKGKS